MFVRFVRIWGQRPYKFSGFMSWLPIRVALISYACLHIVIVLLGPIRSRKNHSTVLCCTALYSALRDKSALRSRMTLYVFFCYFLVDIFLFSCFVASLFFAVLRSVFTRKKSGTKRRLFVGSEQVP